MGSPLPLLLLFVTTLCAVTWAAKFGQPYNVTYDHRSVIINGTRELLLSGSIHYVRSTPTMWPVILQRAKQNNLNMIQTYVFWNIHEPIEGVYNFTENANLLQYLQVCMDLGLYVTLRIGPYIDSEWDFGGFPVWLKSKPGIVFRDYNAPFMDAVTKWVTYIAQLVRPYLCTAGGPIVLLQIENEYGLVESQFGASGKQYSQWIANLARSVIPDVPWVMCLQGDISTVINTYNGLEGKDAFIDTHWAEWPNQPLLWTENNNCVACESWGNGMTHRPTEDIAWATTRWFAAGGSHTNYYMFHGGTNFARTAGGPYMTSHYNFDTALDEYGLPEEPRYSHLAAMHAALIRVGPAVLSQNPPSPVFLGPLQQAWVYKQGSDIIAFISNNDTVNIATVYLNGLQYVLPPRSVSIIVNAITVFNSAVINVQPHNFLQGNVQPSVVSWSYYTEKSGIWNPKTAILANTPPEQINTTQDTTDFLWYSRTLNVTKLNPVLTLSAVSDMVQVFVDGRMQRIGSTGAQVKGPSVSVTLNATVGKHVIDILTVTMGLISFGAHQEAVTKGITGKVVLGGEDITASNWTVQPSFFGEVNQIYTADGGDNVKWVTGLKGGIGVPLTWFLAYVFVPPASPDGAYVVDLLGMTKGFVYFNGKNLGRYWMITSNATAHGCAYCDYKVEYQRSSCYLGCGDYTQRLYHVPREWINFNSKNMLVIFEEIGGDPSSVSIVELGPTTTCANGTEIPNFAASTYLRCPSGTYIKKISFSSFGSPPLGSCGAYKVGPCDSGNTTAIVESGCLGRTYCQLPVSTKLFGDPCPTQQKSLFIQADCS